MRGRIDLVHGIKRFHIAGLVTAAAAQVVATCWRHLARACSYVFLCCDGSAVRRPGALLRPPASEASQGPQLHTTWSHCRPPDAPGHKGCQWAYDVPGPPHPGVAFCHGALCRNRAKGIRVTNHRVYALRHGPLSPNDTFKMVCNGLQPVRRPDTTNMCLKAVRLQTVCCFAVETLLLLRLSGLFGLQTFHYTGRL